MQSLPRKGRAGAGGVKVVRSARAPPKPSAPPPPPKEEEEDEHEELQLDCPMCGCDAMNVVGTHFDEDEEEATVTLVCPDCISPYEYIVAKRHGFSTTRWAKKTDDK